jgi:hypothetical protein
MPIPEVGPRSGLQDVQEPTRVERLFWLTASIISSIASIKLWKGYVAAKPTGCYFCAPPTLTRMIVENAPSGVGLAITAIFIGIAAISFIQLTRPAGIFFTNVSPRE